MQLNASAMTITAIGLLFLGACGSNQATVPASSPAVSSPSVKAQPSAIASPAAKAESGEKHGGQGGQVIESGVYHLEFVPEKEGDTVHLDFYLQKGDSHEAVPGAKVTAQVQLPDGSQKSLPMEYDADGKHYVAKLTGAGAGAYQVAVLSDVQGKKVNGRFKFDQ
jgi:hypothetical protein